MAYLIEHATDQVMGFSQEIANAVCEIKEQYGFSTDEAIRIVEIGVMDINAETRWQEYRSARELEGIYSAAENFMENAGSGIQSVGSSFKDIAKDIRELVTCLCTIDAHGNIARTPTINVEVNSTHSD